MKNILYALLLLISFSSCDAKSNDPDSNVLAQSPKCLDHTQWGIDYKYPTPVTVEYWFSVPRINFTSTSTGFMKVGIPPNTFRNNAISLIVEIHYNYSISGDRLIFDIQKVMTFNALLAKQSELTGQEAFNYAKDLVNLENLGNGVPIECTATTLRFLDKDANAKIPINTYYWIRKN